MPDQQAVLTALSGVRDPELHRDIVSLNMVRELTVEGGRVAFELPTHLTGEDVAGEYGEAQVSPALGVVPLAPGGIVSGLRGTLGLSSPRISDPAWAEDQAPW